METIVQEFFYWDTANTINEALDDTMQEALNHGENPMAGSFFFIRKLKTFLTKLEKAHKESVKA